MAEIKVKLNRPHIPNYIRIEDSGGRMVDIKDLDDATLRALAAEWTDALLAHAKRRREPTR